MQAMDVCKTVKSLSRVWERIILLTSEQSWGFTVAAFDKFLLTLFEKYADLLKKRFSDDFHEVCFTDDVFTSSYLVGGGRTNTSLPDRVN